MILNANVSLTHASATDVNGLLRYGFLPLGGLKFSLSEFKPGRRRRGPADSICGFGRRRPADSICGFGRRFRFRTRRRRLILLLDVGDFEETTCWERRRVEPLLVEIS